MIGFGSTAGAGRSGRGWAAAAAVLAAMLPAAAFAQAGGGGRGGAMQGGGPALQLMMVKEATDSMDLPADTKGKVDDVLKKARTDITQAMQDLRDAPQDERLDKLKDIQKMAADVKANVEAELTPEQKVTFSQKMAALTVKHVTAAVEAERKAADDLDPPADKKKQLDDLFDETTKTLDGFKADAEAVKDEPTGTSVSKKASQAMTDLNGQLLQILGRQDAQKVIAAGRQAMRPNAGGGGGGGANRRARATSQPAAKD
jgi:hypothetical protein